MSLYNSFESLLTRFRPNHPDMPAKPIVFGILTPDEPAFSLRIEPDKMLVSHDMNDADYLFVGDTAIFEAIINPDTKNRVELIEEISLRPKFPFKNYLMAILLRAYDLNFDGLNLDHRAVEDYFPFPAQYPASENSFRLREYIPESIPAYDADVLPALIADEHLNWVAMYNRAWQIAFKNLRQVEPESGFIANFIDTAFNKNTFMWDSCFMMMFGSYARRVFNFMGTLDNFYAKQHDDGFICREISTYNGKDIFQSLDPRSTGPNILAWTEWLDYQQTNNLERLQEVFPVLMAYHRWWRMWHTHADKSYWTSGLGSGMDNQTRVPDSEHHHRHYTWIDAMMQQALNCQMLLNMAQEIQRHEFNQELQEEYEFLEMYINQQMWDEQSQFYYDRAYDAKLSATKSIGAFWGLLSNAVPEERVTALLAHLKDENSFNRPHPIPAQSIDSADYNAYGGYWLGGVWSPTNYMVLRGLTAHTQDDLAYEIAFRHVEYVAKVFENTGTLWENYAPEHVEQGRPARGDFVGWTGLSAISIPIEYLIGIQPLENGEGLLWDIRLTERHGVMRYPEGQTNSVDLIAEARESADIPPELTISTEQDFTLEIRYRGETYQYKLTQGQHHIQLEV